MDYGKTLNLPKTDFPMKANLPQREPETLKFWEDIDIYAKVEEKNSKMPKYILHDGPPYSNAPVHLGQALNKIVKDIIVKYKTLTGFNSPYVPGWDMHGLPIEMATLKKLKVERKDIDPLTLRKKCLDHALHYQKVQKDQFKRLGIRGDWENPYLTVDKTYEATIADIFGQLVKKGFIYRGLKPVHWCWKCETALAEAEIEYKDKKSPSIYVKFELLSKPENLFPSWDKKINFLIWTTTPWTIPGNLAIALKPATKYALVKIKDEAFIIAQEMVDALLKDIREKEFEILDVIDSEKLDGLYAQHPFIDRKSLAILMDYVTLDQGTGCVHTAPGFGQEDYEAGIKNGLPIIVPVDNHGKITEDVPYFAGMHHLSANPKIVEHLENTKHLLYRSETTHSYPHCWRCKEPVIFRATLQWFVAMDVNNLRLNALEAVNQVKWVPSWGRERIYNMIEGRPDWCISRQRIWGTPIPAFYCKSCNEVIYNYDIIQGISKLFSEHGADVWFEKDANSLLPEGFKCPKCGGGNFEKETNIFDVWFESGVSHEAVCSNRNELHWPPDMYLEGSDQHRGWFQLSLLPSIATKGKAPYNTVLTHGWVLDEHGNTMHKSLGNVVDPMEIVSKYGADILRLYFASLDFTSDVKISRNTLNHILEAYRKIRNTCRFMLGNLCDFDKETMWVEDDKLSELDKWILNTLHYLVEKAKLAYENYNFHQVYSFIHTFCIHNLSNLYLDIKKDVLYTYAADSDERRATQRVLYQILNALAVISAPVLSFTAEEIWSYIPAKSAESVFLADWPDTKNYLTKEEEGRWDIILSLRSELYTILEKEKESQTIKQSTEADVKIYMEKPLYMAFRGNEEFLRTIFRVASLELHSAEEGEPPAGTIIPEKFPKVKIYLEPTKNKKCERCWNYVKELVDDDKICSKCRSVVKQTV
ncbi:MAG: isoleucine--tRNA ligase [Armatimonadota bacterium]